MSIFVLWAITLILLLIFTFGVLFLMTRGRRFVRAVCSISLIVAIVGGFFFYSHHHLSYGDGFLGTLYAALRGIISTGRMFFINADYGFLLEANIGMRIIFWLCHVSALIVIQAAFFALFGRRLIESFRLRFGLHREVYIITGSDKYAIILGENIATCDNPHKLPVSRRVVVFLIEEEDEVKMINEKVAHFGGIVKVLDSKNDFRYYLSKTGLGESRLREKKYSIIIMPNDASVPDHAYHVAEYAKEKSVDGENLDIFVFAASEWDREQIESFSQKEDHKYPCTFHIINEADLLIRQMIEKHPPYKCLGLKFNESGEAKRNFNVMILGFGAVGQQALLRLIMNGQFITSDKSRMSATIVDREKEHLEEHFRHYYPSLDICCEIEFLSYDVRDKEFFEQLKGCKDIDYIVVALNSNDDNKQVALDIRLHYKREGLPLPIIAVSEKNEGIHKVQHDYEIFTFGCKEEIYKESVVIREETNHMAKAVNETYKTLYGGKPWHELDWFTQESNRAAADFIPAMLTLAGTTAEKAESEGWLTGNDAHAGILAQTEHLRWNAFHATMGYRLMNLAEMRLRFQAYCKKEIPLSYSRKDPITKLHICLAPWDELDKISEEYNNTTGEARDFKKNDYDIIENIPKVLRLARSWKKHSK